MPRVSNNSQIANIFGRLRQCAIFGFLLRIQKRERQMTTGNAPTIEFKEFRRKQIAELADWCEGFDMTGVSVSDADKQAGSPKIGDKIARNPKNHADRWLVAAAYFADNFEPVEKLAALEKPVPVEPENPDTKYWRNVANEGRGSAMTACLHRACDAIDSLQSALKLAQEERDKWKAEADGQFQYAGRLLEELHKAESLNRRMVEQYRDLVVAAEKIGGKVTDASNLQISIADVLSMKEALAKLEES